MELHQHYHELMAFRAEGMAKYKSRLYYQIYGPQPRISFPSVTKEEPSFGWKRLPMCYVGDRPPIVNIVDEIFARIPIAAVLEIGPGRGDLCKYIIKTHRVAPQAYLGIELDASIRGPYVRVGSLAEVERTVDLVIASEVAEHMPAQNFIADYLAPLKAKLHERSELVISVPNPIVAGGIGRDFSHVQNYPWYDMYAILRLFFGEVVVTRTHFIADPKRLLMFPLRYVFAHASETDWCEGLVFTASHPRLT